MAYAKQRQTMSSRDQSSGTCCTPLDFERGMAGWWPGDGWVLFIWCHLGPGSEYRAYDMCSLFVCQQANECFRASQLAAGSSCNKDSKRRWNGGCVVTFQARYMANETRKRFLLSAWAWAASAASSTAVSRTFTSLCGN